MSSPLDLRRSPPNGLVPVRLRTREHLSHSRHRFRFRGLPGANVTLYPPEACDRFTYPCARNRKGVSYSDSDTRAGLLVVADGSLVEWDWR